MCENYYYNTELAGNKVVSEIPPMELQDEEGAAVLSAVSLERKLLLHFLSNRSLLFIQGALKDTLTYSTHTSTEEYKY